MNHINSADPDFGKLNGPVSLLGRRQSDTLVVIAGMLCCLLLAGCASTPAQPPTTMTTTLTCNLPMLTPLAETEELQSRGGIRISVATVPFQCHRGFSDPTYQRVQPSFAEDLGRNMLAALAGSQAVFIEETITPFIRVEPSRLRFQVTVANLGSRTFRGEGTDLRFKLGDRTSSHEQVDVAQFKNLLLVEREEATVDILGPQISQMSPDQVVGLFVYDVVTKTDAAGNVLERQNFQWLYRYRVEVHQETAQVKKERRWVNVPVSQ